MWERGDKTNQGITELNASSIGMAKVGTDTHKHAINADIYDTLTSSGDKISESRASQRTGGTGAPVKMSGTVKGAQRPLR